MNKPYSFNLLILTGVLILILQACHKPHNDTIDTAEYVLKEVHANGELKISYEYNDSWQLVKSFHHEYINARTGYHRNVAYFYNNDGRLARTETTYEGIGTQPSTTEFTYNSQGRLLTVKAVRKDSLLLYQEDYDYNGQTITKKHSSGRGVDYVSTYTVDDRGNIVKGVNDDLTSGNNDYTEEWWNFDDKKGMGSPGAGDISSKNNPGKYILYAPQRSEKNVLLSYTYNGAGYVTSMKEYEPDFKSTTTTEYVLIPKQ